VIYIYFGIKRIDKLNLNDTIIMMDVTHFAFQWSFWTAVEVCNSVSALLVTCQCYSKWKLFVMKLKA